jgi:D-sedoheptulose 7-phosphate isomerase
VPVLSSSSLAFAANVFYAFGHAEYDNEFPWASVCGDVILVGNGGSAAVASHIATDMVKQGTRARTLTDPAVFSAYANDEGYEHAYERQIDVMAVDYLIAISSSGRSKNILNAVTAAKARGAHVFTFSGFSPTNPLRQLGHVNYYVPSSNYGIVEIAHLTILHSLVNPGVY